VILRALALALLLCPAALAGPREADASSGKLEFSATQADAKFSGAFKRFHVKLDFDPATPAQGRLDVTVEAASIDTKYPQAEYHATRFERAGPGWRADGELTIRGVKKPVPVSFTLVPAGGATVMKGTASLKRLEFGLGRGEWASTEWVGDAVDVRFELKLSPAG
jgi:polyisoprenoid-binding protein YceI